MHDLNFDPVLDSFSFDFSYRLVRTINLVVKSLFFFLFQRNPRKLTDDSVWNSFSDSARSQCIVPIII
jgi:hypothetical protein